MRKIDQYSSTIDTIYPDGYEREMLFRNAGDMVDHAPPEKAPESYVGRFLERFRLWHMKRAGRLILRELSDEQLVDIGITRQQAKEEVSKSYFPKWPSHPM